MADNGRGIAARDHARVFELFRRSGAQDRPGEGIGLAHVKALVRSLGGRIEVTSDLGVGTTFNVTLPRGTVTGHGQDGPPLRLAAGIRIIPRVNAVEIVMIEDDEGHARLIERNIRRAGVNNAIRPFRDGTTALEYLLGADGTGEVSAKRHLLILLDLNLPDMTGIDILEKVKANPHTRRSPVVVLTTTDDQREIQRCYDLGANVYITKPVNYEGFANAIRQLGLFFLRDAGARESMTEPVPQDRGRVLYVDDDPGLGRLVQRALQARGYAVELAPDGDAGLARLEAGGIDVVALDHHMPGQTGLDLLPAIRALPDAPPVVYVTGSEDSRVAVAALKAGAVDYVWKDLQGQFRELLGGAIDTALRQEALRRDKERAEREVREARDRAEIMLREVNHRVANSLALVAALTHMQANAVTDPAAKAALQEMQARISAIAGIHRRLYTSDDVEAVDLDAYLASLVEELQAAMKAAGRDHAIRLRAEPVRLATDKAVSVGVVVTELVTNAYKYAYPAEIPGEIRVSLARAGAEGITLTVEDDGVGWTGEGQPRGTGLGSRIIRAMATNLRSALVYGVDRVGTRATLSFQD